MGLIKRIFEKFKNFKHTNYLIAFLFGCSIAMAGGMIYLHYQYEHYNEIKKSNRPGRATLVVIKGSNAKKVKNILSDIASVDLRGLWLTSIKYTKRQNTLELDVRALDQLDISRFNTMLTAALGKRKLCLKELDLQKRGEKKIEKKSSKLPFFVQMMMKRKKKRKKASGSEDAEKNSEENLRWVYNYKASFKYANCS